MSKDIYCYTDNRIPPQDQMPEIPKQDADPPRPDIPGGFETGEWIPAGYDTQPDEGVKVLVSCWSPSRGKVWVDIGWITTVTHEWSCNLSDTQVLAWMPRPAPYPAPMQDVEITGIRFSSTQRF